jgi:hypothetical protein
MVGVKDYWLFFLFMLFFAVQTAAPDWIDWLHRQHQAACSLRH